MDKVIAAELYRNAADQGHAEAQCSLGYAYWYGHGVPIDKEAALEWWRKAAAQGHKNAQYCTSVLVS
jgi:TPR repeat protein